MFCASCCCFIYIYIKISIKLNLQPFLGVIWQFSPHGPFQLVPSALNRVDLKFCPLQEGLRRSRIHLVDIDSQELVCVWGIFANVSVPIVTKVFNLQLQIGVPSHKVYTTFLYLYSLFPSLLPMTKGKKMLEIRNSFR